MRKALSILFLFGFVGCSTAQHNNSDNQTITLTGTCVLPSTSGQLDARQFDVCLNNVSSSECTDKVEVISQENKIVSTIRTDSSLVVKLEVVSNCCYYFLGDLSVYNDSTLNIIYIPYGENHCACTCLFELEYELKLDCLLLEDRSSQLTHLILNDDLRTLRTVKNTTNSK